MIIEEDRAMALPDVGIAVRCMFCHDYQEAPDFFAEMKIKRMQN